MAPLMFNENLILNDFGRNVTLSLSGYIHTYLHKNYYYYNTIYCYISINSMTPADHS